MKEVTEIQAFVRRLANLTGNAEIQSTEKAGLDDVDFSTTITIEGKVQGEPGLTVTTMKATTANATVPSNATTDQFASQQAFIDAVLAFIANPANEINVVGGVITNDRP